MRLDRRLFLRKAMPEMVKTVQSKSRLDSGTVFPEALYMRAFRQFPGVVLALGAAAACGQGLAPVNGGSWSRAVGFIDSGGIATTPLAVPDTVQARSPFVVTVSTFGSTGCIRPDRSQVQVAGSVADITPYDSVWSNTPPCPPGWQGYPRAVELRFDSAGVARIQLHGRGFDRDLTLQRTITVRP